MKWLLRFLFTMCISFLLMVSCYWCQVSHVGRFRAPGQGLLGGFCVGDHEKW